MEENVDFGLTSDEAIHDEEMRDFRAAATDLRVQETFLGEEIHDRRERRISGEVTHGPYAEKTHGRVVGKHDREVATRDHRAETTYRDLHAVGTSDLHGAKWSDPVRDEEERGCDRGDETGNDYGVEMGSDCGEMGSDVFDEMGSACDVKTNDTRHDENTSAGVNTNGDGNRSADGTFGLPCLLSSRELPTSVHNTVLHPLHANNGSSPLPSPSPQRQTRGISPTSDQS